MKEHAIEIKSNRCISFWFIASDVCLSLVDCNKSLPQLFHFKLLLIFVSSRNIDFFNIFVGMWNCYLFNDLLSVWNHNLLLIFVVMRYHNLLLIFNSSWNDDFLNVFVGMWNHDLLLAFTFDDVLVVFKLLDIDLHSKLVVLLVRNVDSCWVFICRKFVVAWIVHCKRCCNCK